MVAEKGGFQVIRDWNKAAVHAGFYADSDDANDDQSDDHETLDVIGDEADTEASGSDVDCGDGAFDD